MIAAIEDAIIAKAKAVLGNRVREIATLPAGLDAAELGRRLRPSPAVYVSFLGGSAREENALVIDAEFGVFFLVGGANEDERRRGLETRGAPQGSLPKGGAYTLMAALLPHLNGLVVEGAGSLTCTGVNNLFNEGLDDAGVTLYSASLKLPLTMRLMNGDELEDFLEFNAQYVIPPHAMPAPGTPLPYGDADTGDDVALPAAE